MKRRRYKSNLSFGRANAERLRQKMEEEGLDLASVGLATGLSPTTISSVLREPEADRHRTTIERLQSFVEGEKLDPWLVGGHRSRVPVLPEFRRDLKKYLDRPDVCASRAESHAGLGKGFLRRFLAFKTAKVSQIEAVAALVEEAPSLPRAKTRAEIAREERYRAIALDYVNLEYTSNEAVGRKYGGSDDLAIKALKKYGLQPTFPADPYIERIEEYARKHGISRTAAFGLAGIRHARKKISRFGVGTCIRVLEATIEPPPPEIRRLPDPDAEIQFVRLRLRGWASTDIMNKLGINRHKFKALADKYGLAAKDIDMYAEWVMKVARGRSAAEIVRLLGLSDTRVRNIIEKYNIEVRRGSCWDSRRDEK